MRSTHTDNQTCMDTTITVLHLNPTLAVLHPPSSVFSLEDEDFTQMYSPQFLESFREEQSPVEEIEEIQVPVTRKNMGRRCQTAPKKKHQKEKAADQRCIPWTPEEETALCKGWVRIYEDSIKGNVKGDGEVLKESEKWSSGEVLLFMQEREDGKSKRYKSSVSSSFNTKESGEGSINLNTTVGDEAENEVEEVRRPKPMGRDQAKRKMKAGSASSASSFDVEALAKMMASEYVMASDAYNVQKNQEMSELLKLKKQDLELKAAELEIRCMENCQRDEALYETTTDEALKERLRQRLFG
nr:hypothetical protein [Tanacetum cinerariifolium]